MKEFELVVSGRDEAPIRDNKHVEDELEPFASGRDEASIREF